MSDNVILEAIKNFAPIVIAIGVILNGYWQYRAKLQTAKTARIAEKAAVVVAQTAKVAEEKMDDAFKKIDSTKKTVEAVAIQTDGHLSAMEALLQQKSDELAAAAVTLKLETEKVARLTGALHEARGSLPQRRDEDTTKNDPTKG